MSHLQALIGSLDKSLAERVRLVHDQPISSGSEFVLYWMRTAVRVEENPALSVAIETANRLEMPLLVYHGVSERYPFASDRHHTFLLQGARDVQRELVGSNMNYALHVERAEHRGPHLKSLAERAAVVVTEEMPVEPIRRWTALLCRGLKCSLLAVDTACIVPMRLVGKSYERAYEYRNATKNLYAERTSADPIKEVQATHTSGAEVDLPFQPVDLQTSAIDSLVSQCEIDHSIGPVTDTVGGSVAGYQRWEAFKAAGLSTYADERNDALTDGVSRMSAYLH